MNKKNLYFGLIVIVAIAAGAAYYFLTDYPAPNASDTPYQTINDPSSIPPAPVDKSWKKFTDEASGASFLYPEKLPATYIKPVDWPLRIKVLNDTFDCRETDQTAKPGIRTEERRLGTQDYCITTAQEGAAGSTYTDYTYVMAKAGKTVVLSFSLRFVRCENYDAVSRSNCQQERAIFDIDSIVQKIAESVELKQ